MGCCAISRATFTVSPSPIPRIVAFDERFRHHPLQGTQIIALAPPADYRPRVHAPLFCSTFSPKGLHKVRYFGLWHPSKRAKSAQVRLRLATRSKQIPLWPNRLSPNR